MLTLDVFTCYAAAGAGSLVGLGLISLIHTDQPRVRTALRLYQWAFLCLAVLLTIPFSPEAWRPLVTQGAIGLAASGATLLGWAFRQLNGRRTSAWLGWLCTVAAGGVLWATACLGSNAAYTLAIASVFAFIGVAMVIDQGWMILRSPRALGSELSLLVVAVAFALIWSIALRHAATQAGPYPPHWLFVPDWLLPITALAFALLPLSVASVVFAIINQRMNQQLRARALSDDLTGALSRRGLRELGERMLTLQPSQPHSLAVLMMNVDHFKDINDQHGHAVGDDVLRQLAQLTREHLRADALVARYGGAEFTILLPVRSHLEARSVAERLRQVLSTRPCKTRGGPVSITVSIGVSFHQSGSSLEDALARADACLQEAKQNGRNRVVTADIDA